ncbi:MAG: hypothetical protein DWI48_04645 [Chloroflexi bacterium]|nr:MAG: hypothetical protein DWI48_04645 [Chloroflexota bacterium]
MVNKRRRYEADWPTTLAPRRKRLSRWMLIAAIGLVVSVFASTRINRGVSTVPPSATATAVPTVSSTPGIPGDEVLEQRANGSWYVRNPEGWPLVTVTHIVDGDTLDVQASGVTLRVRVFGIDTPERGEPCYTDATKRLEALAGHEVRLIPDKRLQDRNGRELRYVLAPDGLSLDAALVNEGYAKAWRDDGALRDRLVQIEMNASAAKRGCLWANR